MSNVRACQPCRTAKTKCDLKRPICGRCQRQDLPCTGYTKDADFIFRNENTVAQRNSERARKSARQPPVTLTVRGSPSSTASSSSRTGSRAAQQSTSPDSATFPAKQGESEPPWFNSDPAANIPSTPAPPLEDRVVERYFFDWITTPGKLGCASGPMSYLPSMYKAAGDDSVFRTAIQALGYAHLRGYRDETSTFDIKARKAYGVALTRMQAVITDKRKVMDDRVLASVLLLDNFELLHLKRHEPLGPHNFGVKLILEARGDSLFEDVKSLSFWRVANARLMQRQIMYASGPDPYQFEEIQKLNVKRPDVRLTADVLHMNDLIGQVNRFLKATPQDAASTLNEAADLIKRIEHLLAQMDSWASTLHEVWKPKQLNGDLKGQSSQMPSMPEMEGPVPPNLISNHDIWLAFMWHFQSATEIVLRESLIDLIEHLTRLAGVGAPPRSQEIIEREVHKIGELSTNIVKQFPAFTPFVTDDNPEPNPLETRYRLSGRFFAFFAMWVIRKARHVPEADRRVARWVINSVMADYALDIDTGGCTCT